MNTSNTLQDHHQRFGLFAIIESRRIVLPLKGVECDFSVRGGITEVCMSQIFRHENPNPLDCEYLFPLPADASVYFCEADVNGRIIRAEVKERAEARQIVAEKKSAGFRTMLVESERENLFTLGLGNVQPDDLIIIRLKYFQMPRTLGAIRSVEIPFCPGVRYIPGIPLLRRNRGKGIVDDTDQVPDASRITPVRIDAFHPDAAYIDVRGRLDAKFTDPQSLTSPSHTLDVQSSDGELCLTLSNKGEVPARDFVLRWNEREADALAPRAWTREKGDDMYALLEVRAPMRVSAPRTAMDFYFLVDRSGSMAGLKWTKAVEAMHSCVRVLGPEDRAMITLFESSFRDFAQGPVPVGEILEDPEFQAIGLFGTGGGTELAPALQHVLEVAQRQSAGRDQNLILITDAQVGNDAAILNLMKTTAPDMAVHCFGIDIALNDALLLALSRQQGGTFHSLNPNDNIQAAVTTLGKTLRQPVLLDLRLSEGWECADARIPNLHAGQIIYLGARANGWKPLELTARTPSGEAVSFSFQSQPLAEEAPCLHWRKSRIQRLLAEDKQQEAILLSVASNLLCPLTAFVAWDESEKVIISRHELVQPNMDLAAGAFKAVRSRRLTSGLTSRGGAAKSASGLQVPPGSMYACFRSQQATPGTSGIITRFHINPMCAGADLLSACKKFGGEDWQPFCQTITDWFAKTMPDQIVQRTQALKVLILKLNLCSWMQETLGISESADKYIRTRHLDMCDLAFHKLTQELKGIKGDFKDIENLLQHIEEATVAASVEQLSLLTVEIHCWAVAILKSFADNLPA